MEHLINAFFGVQDQDKNARTHSLTKNIPIQIQKNEAKKTIDAKRFTIILVRMQWKTSAQAYIWYRRFQIAQYKRNGNDEIECDDGHG